MFQSDAVHLCAASDASDSVLPRDWSGPDGPTHSHREPRDGLGDQGLPDLPQLQPHLPQLSILETFAHGHYDQSEFSDNS